MSLIVKTLDSKMLQDTQSGIIITARRPHLVPEMTGFIETRLSPITTDKYRIPPELVVILREDQVPDGISNKDFGEAWNQLAKEKGLTGEFYEEDVLAAVDLAVSNKKLGTENTKTIRKGGNLTVSTTTGEADSKKVIKKTIVTD